MQQLQHNNSQSEAIKNLVKRTPVKEREKLSSMYQTRKTPKTQHGLHQIRLDLEILAYWLLSKYAQSRSR